MVSHRGLKRQKCDFSSRLARAVTAILHRIMADGSAPKLLVVGVDSKRLQWIAHHVTSQWPQTVLTALPQTQGSGLAALIADPEPDAVLLHLDFGTEATAAAGIDCLLHTLRAKPQLHIIVIAAAGDEISAVRALKSGAKNYLPLKLISKELLLTAIAEARVQREEMARAPKMPTRVLSAAKPAPAAAVVPGYEIFKTISTSNFSSVYLARCERLRRNVILKVMNRGDSAREIADAERFQREYEIISSVSHPAIVEIHDYGMLTGQLYLAMEYFPCGDLRARLRNPLSVEESLYYLRAIAHALRVIHVFGIFHRDLKPANVMLRADNSPVLIDFGLARRSADQLGATGAGKVLGSPYYMSPEQAQAISVDARTDIYSLGVMFHEMLTGRKPYVGPNAVTVMAQHIKAGVPQLPVELAAQQDLLDRLMAKDLHRRYASADELLADLSLQRAAA